MNGKGLRALVVGAVISGSASVGCANNGANDARSAVLDAAPSGSQANGSATSPASVVVSPATIALVATTTTTTTTPTTTTTLRPSPPLPTVECSPTSTAEPIEPVNLEIWSTLSEEAETAAQGLILQFNSTHPGINLGALVHGTEEEFRRLMSEGTRPDLLIMGLDALVNFADGGVATPVQRCIDNDPTFDSADFVPIMTAAYQLDGTQIGLPLTVSTPVLFYDRSQFLNAGLDPDNPPQTLDELRTDVQSMRAAGLAADGLTYGDASWFVTQWAAQSNVSLAENNNGHDVRSVNGTQINLTDSSLIAILEALQQLASEGIVSQPVTNATPYDDLVRLVAPTGPVAAMNIHTSGSLNFAYDNFSEVDASAELGVGALPGPGTGALVGGSGMWLTTPDSDKAWAAWQAIRYFTDAAQQVTFAKLGYAPVRQSTLLEPALLAMWQDRPGLRVPYDQLIGAEPGPANVGMVGGTRAHILWRLNWLAEDVIRGRDIAEAVADAQKDIDTVVATYNRMRYGSP